MSDTYCESRFSFLSHSALWFERDQHVLINVFESTLKVSKKTTPVPKVRWLRSLQALLYLPFCLFHLWTLDPPARGKKHSCYESRISCIFCFSVMQFIISVNDRVSLPCPPADLVQEDLWGRRSPEIQAPPGNIQHRCQRDLDGAHTKFLLSKGCSHRVFQSLQLTAVPFVLGCPHQVPPVDQVVPLGQRYPAGKRDCVSFWMSFNMKLKAFRVQAFVWNGADYLCTKKADPWWSCRSRRSGQASVPLNRKGLVIKHL